MFDHPRSMEPLFPRDRDRTLAELGVTLAAESAELGASLPIGARAPAARILESMNSFYSNLIEGHATHPIEIDQALHGDYSNEPAKRALQLESVAHIAVQKRIEERLSTEPNLPIATPEFLCWIHREFYQRMPPEFRRVKGEEDREHEFVPGELRRANVRVGRHVPPAHEALPLFLARFADSYEPSRLHGTDRFIGAAASHHRLAWIHPFMDGNGRVTRLFTHAYFIRTRLDAHGLWTVSRGLSRHRPAYLTALMDADKPRENDYDGRGNLSDRGLTAFCRFFFETARDQIHFMSSLLDSGKLQSRVVAYASHRAALNELPPESAFLLREALLRGEFPRGEAPRITGRPERSARRILDELVKDGLLVSATPKGPVRLDVPVKAIPYFFPHLYPESIEMDMANLAISHQPSAIS